MGVIPVASAPPTGPSRRARIAHVPPALRRFAFRLAQAAFALLAVSVIVFGASRLSGDPAKVIVEEGGGGSFEYNELRAELGLDKPITEQYTTFLGSAVRGDLGISY